MSKHMDADFLRSAKVPYDEELSEWELGWNDACDALAEDAQAADVPDRKVGKCEDFEKITEAHERIGYDRGFRDGYAQAVEDARKLVGADTWAGSRISRLQLPAQPERK